MPQQIGGFPVPESIINCLGVSKAADLFGYDEFVDEEIDVSRCRVYLLREFKKILELQIAYPIFKKYFISEKGRHLRDEEVIRLLCTQGQNNLAEDINWLKKVFTPNTSVVTSTTKRPISATPQKKRPSAEKPPPCGEKRVTRGSSSSKSGLKDSCVESKTSVSQSSTPGKSKFSLIISGGRNNPDRELKPTSAHQKSDTQAMNSPKLKSPSKRKVGSKAYPQKMKSKPVVSSGTSSDEDIIPSTQDVIPPSSAIRRTLTSQNRLVKAKTRDSLSRSADDSSGSSDGQSANASSANILPAEGKQSNKKSNDSSDEGKRSRKSSNSDESNSSDSDGSGGEMFIRRGQSPANVSNSSDKFQTTKTERSSPIKKETRIESVGNDSKKPLPSSQANSDDSHSAESDDQSSIDDGHNAQKLTETPRSAKSPVEKPSCVLGELSSNRPEGSSEDEESKIVDSRKRKASESSADLRQSKVPKTSPSAPVSSDKMSGTSDSESDSGESESAQRPVRSNLSNDGIADEPKIDTPAILKKAHPFDSTRLPGVMDVSFPGNDISGIGQFSTPPVAKDLKKVAKTTKALTPANQRSISEFLKPTPPVREPADDDYAGKKEHYLRLGFTDLNEEFDFESKTATCAEDLLDDESEVYVLQCPEEVDSSRFLGQTLEIDSKDPNTALLKDGQFYETYCDAYDPSRIANFIIPSRRMKRFSLHSVPILGKITVSEAVAVPKVPDFDMTPSTPVPFPTNLKPRNSLASSNSSVISDTSSQSSYRLVSKKPKAAKGSHTIKTPEKQYEKISNSIMDNGEETSNRKKKNKKDKDKKLNADEVPNAAELPILTQPFLELDTNNHKKKKKKKKDQAFNDNEHQVIVDEIDVKEQQFIDKVAVILDAEQDSSKKKKKKKKQEQAEAEALLIQDPTTGETGQGGSCEKKKKKKNRLEEDLIGSIEQETAAFETEQEERFKKKKKKKKHVEEERGEPIVFEEEKKNRKEKKNKNKLKAELSEQIDGDSYERQFNEIRDVKEQLLVDQVAGSCDEVPMKKKKKKHRKEMLDEIDTVNPCESQWDDKEQLLIDLVTGNLEEVSKKKKKKHEKEMLEDAVVPLKKKKAKKAKTECQS